MYCTKFPTLPSRFTLLKGNHGVGLFEWIKHSIRRYFAVWQEAPPQGPWWEPRPEASISALAEVAQRPGPAVLIRGGGGNGLLEPDGEVGHAPSPCHSNRPDICASWPVLQGAARLFWLQIYWLQGLCVCTWTSVCECLRTSLWKWNQLQLKDNMRQLSQCILLA